MVGAIKTCGRRMNMLFVMAALFAAGSTLGGVAGSVLGVAEAAPIAPYCENDRCSGGKCKPSVGNNKNCDRTGPASCTSSFCF